MTIPPDDALAVHGLVIATLAIDRLAGATLGRCEAHDPCRGASYGWTGRRRRCTAIGVRVRLPGRHAALLGGPVRCVCPRHGYKPGVTPIVPADGP